MVAADDGVGFANQCQGQKLVVFGVAAGGLNVQYICFRYGEKVRVLTDQRHKRQPGFCVKVAVKFIPFESLFQLVQGGA